MAVNAADFVCTPSLPRTPYIGTFHTMHYLVHTCRAYQSPARTDSDDDGAGSRQPRPSPSHHPGGSPVYFTLSHLPTPSRRASTVSPGRGPAARKNGQKGVSWDHPLAV